MNTHEPIPSASRGILYGLLFVTVLYSIIGFTVWIWSR